MGTPIQDGPIEFLVESLTLTDASSAVTPSAWKQLVKVRLTNTGTAPQSVSPIDQRMIDAAGSKYHPDPVALGGVNESGVSPLLLQPGETATMTLPFANGPGDPKPAMVVLHAGPNTPGVVVKLTAPHAGSGSAPGP